MANNKCFMCRRPMKNEFQCTNSKCARGKLPKELQAEVDRQESEAKNESGAQHVNE